MNHIPSGPAAIVARPRPSSRRACRWRDPSGDVAAGVDRPNAPAPTATCAKPQLQEAEAPAVARAAGSWSIRQGDPPLVRGSTRAEPASCCALPLSARRRRPRLPQCRSGCPGSRTACAPAFLLSGRCARPWAPLRVQRPYRALAHGDVAGRGRLGLDEDAISPDGGRWPRPRWPAAPALVDSAPRRQDRRHRSRGRQHPAAHQHRPRRRMAGTRPPRPPPVFGRSAPRGSLHQLRAVAVAILLLFAEALRQHRVELRAVRSAGGASFMCAQSVSRLGVAPERRPAREALVEHAASA